VWQESRMRGVNPQGASFWIRIVRTGGEIHEHTMGTFGRAVASRADSDREAADSHCGDASVRDVLSHGHAPQAGADHGVESQQ
jgi:hypothetical protein